MTLNNPKLVIHNHLSIVSQEYALAWGLFYDEHAATLYGICLKITGNKKVASELLLVVFKEIQKKALAGAVFTIPLCFIKIAYKIAIEYIAPKDMRTFTRELLTL